MKQVLSDLCRNIPACGFLLLASSVLFGSSGLALCAEMPGAEEIARFQERSFDNRRNTTIEFSASVTNTTRWAQPAGKFTFMVYCTLNEIKESSGRTLSQRLSGPVEIRVMDCDNKVVASARKALEKMCST